MAVKRYKDYVLLYDLDFRQQVIARQRTYKETLNEEIQTPITPLTLARTVPATGNKVIDATVKLATEFTDNVSFTARHVLCCLRNPYNKGKISEFKVIVPYRPTDAFHKSHVREILKAKRVVNGSYNGECHRTIAKLKPFL